MTTILKNIRIFSGMDNELVDKKAIIIKDGKIVEIIPDQQALENADVIDMKGAIVSPGFIDCHLHLLIEEIPDKEQLMNDQSSNASTGGLLPNVDSYVAYRGARAARKTLLAGFTTAFDGGGVNYIDVALREAINLGCVDGPNYYICGRQLAAWTPHFRGFADDVFGPWGMRKAIRDRLYWGVNHIKIEMSAPLRIVGRSMDKSSFSMEEIEAATDEAHSAGLQVSAHARGPKPIMDSLNGGIDIIVHGTGISDAGIELMLKKGRYCFPTLASPLLQPADHIKAVKTSKVIGLLEKTGKVHWDSVRRMHKAGVKMALSTDSGGIGVKHGENAVEMLRMKEIGLTNLECLKAATSEAAHAVGLADRIGRIAVGYDADIIAFHKNPLDDLNAVTDVCFVMKSGKIYKRQV
jgi:imidazolonepropionase-like amidohydrolase